jgi:hypothetical protein
MKEDRSEHRENVSDNSSRRKEKLIVNKRLMSVDSNGMRNHRGVRLASSQIRMRRCGAANERLLKESRKAKLAPSNLRSRSVSSSSVQSNAGRQNRRHKLRNQKLNDLLAKGKVAHKLSTAPTALSIRLTRS